jgi:hypothetical protein
MANDRMFLTRRKAFAVPAQDGGGFDNENAGLLALPDRAERDPQQSIRIREFQAFHGALKDADLVAQHENL